MATFRIAGPGGDITLTIDPDYGIEPNEDSPPPFDANTTGSRAIVVHPIPGREGDRKQDNRRDDDVLTVSGMCKGDIAGAIMNMKNTSNSGDAYTITDSPDAGPGISYPPMWIRRASIGRRRGSSIWFTFSIGFIEKSQTP
jgi:hypothetical protein